MSWIRRSKGIELEFIKNVSVHTLDIGSNGTLYAAGGHVFTSTDNGDNWSDVGGRGDLLLLTQEYLFNASIYYGEGITRSANNGGSWTSHTAGLENVEITSIDVNPVTGELYVGTSNGVFISSDNGESWSTAGLSENYISVLTITSDGIIFAGDKYGEGIYKSIDKGINWTRSIEDLTMTVLLINSAGYIFAGTSDGVFFTTDAGKTWNECSEGFQRTSIGAMAMSPDGYLYAGTHFGGVYRSQQSTFP